MTKDAKTMDKPEAGAVEMPESVRKILASGKKLTSEKHPQVAVEEKTGYYLIGTYRLVRPMPGTDNGTLHQFSLEETNAPISEWDRDARARVAVKVDAGTIVEIKGNTALDRMLPAVVGHRIGITYLGKQDSQKRKGQRFHNYEVVDLGN